MRPSLQVQAAPVGPDQDFEDPDRRQQKAFAGEGVSYYLDRPSATLEVAAERRDRRQGERYDQLGVTPVPGVPERGYFLRVEVVLHDHII